MTTNENIMEEMLDRATNPSRENIDELSSQMFCMVVRSNPILVDKALKMIMTKVRSKDITESTRAINLLEECMSKCGPEFQAEVAKFRFLNELVYLVSKKFQGGETPAAIKKRIIECLLLWTAEYPQKTKIQEVYKKLCLENEVDQSTTPVVESKRESTLGIDEKMLSMLINSKDPENYKRANLLIQNRVKQDARRMDFMIQHKSFLQEVTNTVELLEEMLNMYETEGKDVKEQSESISVMRELYHSCKKYKPTMERLPTLLESCDESLIVDAVEINDSLQNVIKRFKTSVGTPTQTQQTNISLDSTIDAKVPKNASENPLKSGNADLLSDLFGDETNVASSSTTATFSSIVDLEMFGATGTSVERNAEPPTISNPLDDLKSIFDVDSALSGGVPAKAENISDVFSSNILEPTPVSSAKTDLSSALKDADVEADKNSFRKMPTIDKLSEDLFQASLRDLDRVYSFKRTPEKHTLNALAEEKLKCKPISLTHSKNLQKDQNNSENVVHQEKSEEKISNERFESDDDLIISTKSEICDAEAAEAEISKTIDIENIKEESPIKRQTIPLADIEIDLDKVEPAPGDRVLWDDDDIKVMLTFTKDRPSKEVSVIVISVSNKSKLPVQNFRFDASVHKPCKVRLLPPTSVTMPPHKPFRPATPINQVMLLLNPTCKPTDVTCFLGYTLGDDPDPIKEWNVAKDIPYVE
ncbi:ADP-ribosylation factor-binding protein GGA1 [Zeugodacus cucurbitae]|uniref:ADP-ribosylation factor-binding protein GGA1 n=1 Tax=Zeugodacus cucurbitae TaxID=28588 RepID=UPI0023D90789|nr:ADP-ribosylation factor-binding protein GGA1 [Zeugodacus cucurbitae]